MSKKTGFVLMAAIISSLVTFQVHAQNMRPEEIIKALSSSELKKTVGQNGYVETVTTALGRMIYVSGETSDGKAYCLTFDKVSGERNSAQFKLAQKETGKLCYGH